MHVRVEQLPQPDPDYRRFLQVIRRERVNRIPLIELAVHPEVVNALLDEPFETTGDARAVLRRSAERAVRIHHRLGYDVVRASAPIPFGVSRLTADDPSGGAVTERQWADEHHGPIATLADVEQYQWPKIKDVDFGPLEAATAALPDGMRLVGFCGGILEFTMDLLGMERCLIATRRNPDLVKTVIDHVGQIVVDVFETYCQMESVCAVWLGDDMGYKHGLLVSPAFLRQNVFPWYRKLRELAHRRHRPFLLHSCGNVEAIIPDLIEDVQIDAKHSFEDVIEPVERFADRWGGRVAVLGGVDVHLLSVGGEEEIRQRVRAILEQVAPRGGYACGSGNSIPNYVPPDHYLAMIEEVHDFNGRL